MQFGQVNVCDPKYGWNNNNLQNSVQSVDFAFNTNPTLFISRLGQTNKAPAAQSSGAIKAVYFNDVDITKIDWNGVQVFDAAFVGW